MMRYNNYTIIKCYLNNSILIKYKISNENNFIKIMILIYRFESRRR